MTDNNVKFSEITAPTPTVNDTTRNYQEIVAAYSAASTADEQLATVVRWDALRRELGTWSALVNLRFEQNTRSEEYRKAREYKDEIMPQLTELEIDFKRRLLQSRFRPQLEGKLGKQAFELWACDVLTFDPAIKDDLVAESKLTAEYVGLLAAAEFEYRGQKYNMPGIEQFAEDPDRQVRHETSTVKWNWFAEHGGELDRIYADLVHLRSRMASKLGFDSYVAMGYKLMRRIDYSQAEVEKYREEVRKFVVPLCSELRRKQQEKLGVDKLFAWDEPIHDVKGNPRPQGDHDWMIAQAVEMFDELGGGLGEFFRLMVSSDLMDLKTRDGKAGGGFCTDFPSYGLPYIYANFNGTKGDVEVFAHEIGHAFQGYSSRHHALVDYFFPTYESCEIHSMSLEFLTWPHMDKFFGADEANRFRKLHLAGALLFLPYGVAVDHFQHLVYGEPDATPARRHEMWKEMERMYLPHRDWGDLQYPAMGGRWQSQRHIYLYPFYYIDYTLAQCCALQFWVRAGEDFPKAMADYVALCRRGGEAPFQELTQSAGLISPFAEGCLAGVVEKAREKLNAN